MFVGGSCYLLPPDVANRYFPGPRIGEQPGPDRVFDRVFVGGSSGVRRVFDRVFDR